MKLGDRKIADNENVASQEFVSSLSIRLLDKERQKGARVQVKTQCASSSRSSDRSLPASSAGFVFGRRRFAASHSRSESDTGPTGTGTGLNSTTGFPWRVMSTPSPLRARSISSDRLFFASATL